jgi:RimJ/RimL family protein N-acetyltransferase
MLNKRFYMLNFIISLLFFIASYQEVSACTRMISFRTVADSAILDKMHVSLRHQSTIPSQSTRELPIKMEQRYKPTFSSKRIIFKTPEMTDAKDILENISWDIVRNLGSLPWPFSLEHTKDFILECDKLRKEVLRYDYAMRLKESGDFLGISSLHVGVHAGSERPGQIGYWVAEKHQGRGYGTEAANEMIELARILELPMVWASVRFDNLQSISILKKIGLVYDKQQIGNYENKEINELIYRMDIKN